MKNKTMEKKPIIISAILLGVLFIAVAAITVVWVIPEDVPVLITAPAAEVTSFPSPDELSFNDIVYKTAEGRLYHSVKDCISVKEIEIYFYQAIEEDLEPCPDCFKNNTATE